MFSSEQITVHLPCFVAYGVAKNTEDYIEAVYRWSTGAVELFWATLFSNQITEFLVVGVVALCFGLACFGESGCTPALAPAPAFVVSLWLSR